MVSLGIITKLRQKSLVFYPALCWFALSFLPCYSFGTPQGTAVELEKTPSRSHYFDWINSQYEGTTEAQTLTNMDFFQWLHDKYGMILDVYALDVGNIDDGPYTAGVGRLIPYHYGTMQTEEFKSQFPNGFAPLVKKAAGFGGRLAVWMGPDGFGTTPEEEKARIDMLVSLCRDYNFIAFKIDAVAGQLRPGKQDVFKRAIQACRKYCPDLMILDHRVKFGAARPVVTTSLWEGVETYIDVFMPNDRTATHHRAGSLARETTPGLTRRLEDHGVCLSSCLDFWEDELVLQAFNRSLLLSPSVYGNPWFLRDDEYPKFARIFNLHKRFKDILVEAVPLPEDRYGPHAVSRGGDDIRFITLRNLTWDTKTYRIELDERIGLTKNDDVSVRMLFPAERILGDHAWGDSLEVEVLPFRTCLILASTGRVDEFGVLGCDYEVVRDTPGKPVIIKLLGMPGSTANIRLPSEYREFSGARIDGVEANGLIQGKAVEIDFPGAAKNKPWHRKIGGLEHINVPDDAEALYEATCFAADNNALEVRAAQRSGPSAVSQVRAARDAFFNKSMFVNRGIWDKNLFDSDLNTFFMARFDDRAFRVDFGEPVFMDRLVIKIRDRQEHDLNPALHAFDEGTETQVSTDLKSWTTLELGWEGKGTIALARVASDLPIRYLRIHGAPQRIAEVEARLNGKKLDRSGWRASNLFYSYRDRPAVSAWSLPFHLEEVHKNSYLAVALNGRHGDEGAYAALRVGDTYIGAPDRSVSFPSNTWEYFNVESETDYTYYFPIEAEMVDMPLEIVVLTIKGGLDEIKPEVWITAYPIPYESRVLTLIQD
jgi:hypothetical protein